MGKPYQGRRDWEALKQICLNLVTGKSNWRFNSLQVKMHQAVGENLSSQCLLTMKLIPSQVMISFTSQSRLGYAKYKMRNEGRANRIVISMYRAKIAALAGIAYRTIKRNMTTSGNLAVRCIKNTRDFRRKECILSTLK